ncbi:uncharacterized protein LOC104856537 isoform X2 [Fukomys damarensis]|uniref:uncharacterized protein LOC104856537 isoform X2 n=1 Tax=Fukomys damarensis TaxID=885580 RepID=UPI001455675D|nr:uncharacterized protein LOC104856537 isoform X2 [Fukomys damarensis]
MAKAHVPTLWVAQYSTPPQKSTKEKETYTLPVSLICDVPPKPHNLDGKKEAAWCLLPPACSAMDCFSVMPFHQET